MFNLIIKDLLLQKSSFKSSLLFIIVFLIFMKGIPSGSFYYLLSITISFMFCITPLAYEERNKSDIVAVSLPITKKEIIISKYLSIFFFTFMSILVVFIIVEIAKLTKLPLATLDLITLKEIEKILISSILLCSVSFPIYFKLGFTKGKIVSGILFLIFYFAAFTISISPMEEPNKSILLTFEKLFTGNNSILLILICMTIFIISMLFSINIYENKEF